MVPGNLPVGMYSVFGNSPFFAQAILVNGGAGISAPPYPRIGARSQYEEELDRQTLDHVYSGRRRSRRPD